MNLIYLKIYKFFLKYFLFLFILTNFSFAGDNIRFEHLGLKEGLSQISIYCILQDIQGFIWFGTEDGLNKYDGYKFTVFRNSHDKKNSLSSNFILSVFEDAQSNLWIGTRGGGLNKFDRKDGKFIHYLNNVNNIQSLSNNIVWSILEDSAGELWIGTSDGLNRFNRKDKSFIYYKKNDDDLNSLSNNTVWTMFEDTQNNLWIGTRGGGLNKFDRNREKFISYQNNPDNSKSISNNFVKSILEDRDGALWIGTRGGLNKFDKKSRQFYRYQSQPDNPQSLSNDLVYSIFEDARGNLWIGTRDGLNKFDKNSEKFIHYKNRVNNIQSLSNNLIYSIFEDDGGNIWIGTASGGINKFDPREEKFIHYQNQPNDSQSISNNFVRAIFEDSADNLWIGTRGGLDKYDRKEKKFIHYYNQPDNPHSLSNNFVRVIFEDSGGNIWIGTRDGLNKLDLNMGKFIHYYNQPDNPKSLSNNYIWSIFEDNKGRLWIGTRRGLNKFDRNNDTFKSYYNQPDNPKSISNNMILTIYEDNTGNLWIGTSGGLNQFNIKKESFIRYKNHPDDPQSLSNDIIKTILEDSKGDLWIGTLSGLNKLNKKERKFTQYREKDGLSNDVIYGILEDNIGNLWMSTNKGINKFNLQTEIFTNYDEKDGLQNNEFNAGAFHKGASGRMYFGGIKGLNEFYPDSIKDNTYTPTVVITDFLLFNKSVSNSDTSIFKQCINFTKEITLDYSDYIFALEFSTLNYRQSEKNQFSYKLEGFNENWIDTGHKHRRATYTNLSPGSYIFHVKASNDDGYWNEAGTSVKITILPPFWMTLWFRIIITLFIFSFVLLIHMRRTYLIKRKNKELKKHNSEMQVLKNYLSNIINSMPSALIGVDIDGKITQWNNEAEHSTGITVENAIGQSLSKIFPYFSKEMEQIGRAINDRHEHVYSKKKREEKGNTIYEDITIFPLIANGVDGAVIRIDNVTDQVRLEEMMIQSEKMLSVGGLAAGMAHEINNPLAGMMQTSDVMANRLGKNIDMSANLKAANESGTDIEAIKKFMELRNIPRMLKAINESGRRVADIVNNMLSFARKSEAQESFINLSELMDKTIVLAMTDFDLKKKYDFKMIDIKKRYEGNLPSVKCEGSKIQQVFLNILRNGSQAMQDSKIEKPSFIIQAYYDKIQKMVIIEITDNGPGMSDKIRKRIFEPFFTTKPVGVGTGLGLSVSYFIITENHHGKMNVESTPGKGAKFIISLPLEGRN